MRGSSSGWDRAQQCLEELLVDSPALGIRGTGDFRLSRRDPFAEAIDMEFKPVSLLPVSLLLPFGEFECGEGGGKSSM